MTDAVYVYSGYALTAGILGGYAAWVIAKARRARRLLDADGATPPIS